MALPSLSKFFPEIVGKPVSDFTIEDWQTVAYKAATFADELRAELCPPRKKLGRPRKPEKRLAGPSGSVNFLAEYLRGPSPAVRKRGRPVQEYYGLPLATIDEIAESVASNAASPEVRKKWPAAPRSRRYVLRIILGVLRKKTGIYHDLPTVERALRRFRADKNKK